MRTVLRCNRFPCNCLFATLCEAGMATSRLRGMLDAWMIFLHG